MAVLITWYQVYLPDKIFGFKTDGLTILDHPNRFWIGANLKDYKQALLRLGVKQVSKICEYESSSN